MTASDDELAAHHAQLDELDKSVKGTCVAHVRRHGRRRSGLKQAAGGTRRSALTRGCSAITAIPPSASTAPATSQRVSATPSTTRSQTSATAIYTPPYAA